VRPPCEPTSEIDDAIEAGICLLGPSTPVPEPLLGHSEANLEATISVMFGGVTQRAHRGNKIRALPRRPNCSSRRIAIVAISHQPKAEM
jgi:hypothetical protein